VAVFRVKAWLTRVQHWFVGLVGESTAVILPVPSVEEDSLQASLIMGASLRGADEEPEPFTCMSYNVFRVNGMPSLIHPNEE
jgi:hypothetical protein